MSALTPEQRDQGLREALTLARRGGYDLAERALVHVIQNPPEATEAAVRAQIAADIDGAVSSTHPNRGYRDGIVYAAWIANGGAS